MILADKIMMLRKKNGWSQEELAEKLNVSRQSVSKWEGAQSVPDLNKILTMSQIFGVSTDYLLKDEIELEDEKISDSSYEQEANVRKVSMEEANEFLHVKKMTAGKIATATSICILSPICLLVLGAASDTGRFGISENAAAGIGLTVILIMVAAAVAMFISCGMKTGRFEFLEKEVIETEYGVDGMVKDRKNEYQGTYTRHNIIGTCCCIMAAIPLFAAMAFLGERKDDFIFVLAIAVLLVLVSIGVWFFIEGGIQWA
ncbi:MAG: helix-turn-helix domain-containing protein, partial [Lachnospiraceae bacterium]